MNYKGARFTVNGKEFVMGGRVLIPSLDIQPVLLKIRSQVEVLQKEATAMFDTYWYCDGKERKREREAKVLLEKMQSLLDAFEETIKNYEVLFPWSKIQELNKILPANTT